MPKLEVSFAILLVILPNKNWIISSIDLILPKLEKFKYKNVSPFSFFSHQMKIIKHIVQQIKLAY